MISPAFFYNILSENHVDFFTGVPDSLLKDFCAYLTDNLDASRHIIAANEGSSVALATGHYLACGSYSLVYMQNSGIGNAVNPLLSLADSKVYSIPMLLLVGWRGEPGIKDEPQHLKQGEVTLSLFDAMQIPYAVLNRSETEIEIQLTKAFEYIREFSAPYALIVQKGTFDSYSLPNQINDENFLSREVAIEKILSKISTTDIVVSTTGMISRELFELREKESQSHATDFLTVGSMGHASQIALGIAKEKKDHIVYCFDGDGAALMHMGALAINASLKPKNFIHIIFNNGAHDSVGGQPTVGLSIDFPTIAKACGYKEAYRIDDDSDLDRILEICKNNAPALIEFRINKGARKDLRRPTTTPLQNKNLLIDFLNKK